MVYSFTLCDFVLKWNSRGNVQRNLLILRGILVLLMCRSWNFHSKSSRLSFIWSAPKLNVFFFSLIQQPPWKSISRDILIHSREKKTKLIGTSGLCEVCKQLFQRNYFSRNERKFDLNRNTLKTFKVIFRSLSIVVLSDKLFVQRDSILSFISTVFEFRIFFFHTLRLI